MKGGSAGSPPAGTAASCRPTSRWRLFALATLVLVTGAARAAFVTSALTGRVTSVGSPVAGVSVSVVSESLIGMRQTVTGPSGVYFVDSLPPGRYEVTFARTGLQTLSRPAIVELGRVARADVQLEPSEEDETVTSTVKDIDVSRTTTVTTHFSDAELDRLPVVRTAASVAALSPGRPRAVRVDEVSFTGTLLLAEDLLAEATILRAAVPPPHLDFDGGVIALRTRGAGGETQAAVRDTLSNAGWLSERPDGSGAGTRHLTEVSAGGPLIGEWLRGFASFWTGDSVERTIEDLRGADVRLDARLGRSHFLGAHYLDVQQSGLHRVPPGASLLSLRYTGSLTGRTTVDALAARSAEGRYGFFAPSTPPFLDHQGEDLITGRISHVLAARTGDHLLTAGLIRRELRVSDAEDRLSFTTSAFFAGDRWMSGRWSVEAALQYQRHETGPETVYPGGGRETTLPRAAIAYDLTGTGRFALSASHAAWDEGRFDEGVAVRVSTLGYAMAFGSSGLARVDLVRVSRDGAAGNELQAEGRYRLFDRYDAGATWTFSPDSTAEESQPLDHRHVANGWLGAEIPFGPNTFGVTVLQRYASTQEGERELSTAAGVRYTWPVARLRVTAAVDGTGLLRHGALATTPRSVRAWVRVRL